MNHPRNQSSKRLQGLWEDALLPALLLALAVILSALIISVTVPSGTGQGYVCAGVAIGDA